MRCHCGRDGLHRAIGRWLADRLGTTRQTLARWEKDKVPIPGPADILLRVIYLSKTFGRTEARLGLRLRELESTVSEVTFTSRDGKWQPGSDVLRAVP